MSWVDRWVSIAFFTAMAAPLVFVIIYATRRFGRSWEGAALMALELLFFGFLLNGVLFFVLGQDYVGRTVFRLVLFTAMPIILWTLTILLIQAQRERRRLLRVVQDAAASVGASRNASR